MKVSLLFSYHAIYVICFAYELEVIVYIQYIEKVFFSQDCSHIKKKVKYTSMRRMKERECRHVLYHR